MKLAVKLWLLSLANLTCCLATVAIMGYSLFKYGNLSLWLTLGIAAAFATTMVGLANRFEKIERRIKTIDAIDREFREVFGVRRTITSKQSNP